MSTLKNQILTELFRRPGLTRVELARDLKVQTSTISIQVARMVDDGLICELDRPQPDSPPERGRKRVPIGIDPDAFYALGLDLGTQHVRGVLIGGNGEILASLHEQRAWKNGPDAIRAVKKIARDLVSRLPSKGRLAGVGFADPGLVDQERRISLVAVNVPGWRNVDVPGFLADQVPGPVSVVNSTVAKCIAEQLRGRGTGVKDFIFMDLGVGVAAGMVFGGRLLRGSRGLAGELGHTCVNPAGRPCSCGAVGCLEAECSGWAIVKNAEDLLDQGASQTILQKSGLTARTVVEAALANDTLAQRVLAQAGRSLGIALANLVNLLNPELFIFGGGLSAAGETLFAPARQTMLERTLAPSKENIRFETTTLGLQAGAWGAALWILENYYAQPLR
jgi:N-acetylglucosamine repressor